MAIAAMINVVLEADDDDFFGAFSEALCVFLIVCFIGKPPRWVNLFFYQIVLRL